MKKSSKIKTIICVLMTLTLAGCGKNKSTKINSNGENEIQPAVQGKTAVKLKHLNAETSAYLTDKTIAVVLGHSYNDEATVANLTQLLNLNYGVEKEDFPALVKVLVYPEDFMVAGKVRVSSIYSILEEKNLAGIITIGAPEGLCNALARLEDKDVERIKESIAADSETADDSNADQDNSKIQNTEETKEITRSYPVFSLFPQDDILGSESTADFVLDYVQNSTMDQEAADFVPFDVSSMLISSVQNMINLRGPVPQDKNLLNFVQKLAGKQKTVKRYFDSETGLISVNHFIFE